MLLLLTSVSLRFFHLLEIVDQIKNAGVKVIEKLPEESSATVQGKDMECGPQPSEFELSEFYPNHLLLSPQGDR